MTVWLESWVMTDVTITVRENGSYKVEGPVRLLDADGNEFALPQGKALALCRCGHSAKKPYCDGTHRQIGFDAPERASDSSPG